MQAPRRTDKDARATVAIMGATGTGKSTFIKHITGDSRIVIGHKPDSETFDVETYCYHDPDTDTLVTLVDTPGFDDSREGITDTDILEKIAAFLQKGGGRKLNGIIYMYRISDVRMGGMSRKNLKMFKELCGDDRLCNVRIVGTNWDRVGFEEGREREADLAQGPFKPLLNAGATLARQDNGKTTALSIMSELVPKPAVVMKITEEMNSGKTLGETSAGGIIADQIAEMQRRHEEEMEELRRDMEEAAEARNEELRAQLAAEHNAIVERMKRAVNDRIRLQQTRIAELERKLRGNEREMMLERRLAELEARLEAQGHTMMSERKRAAEREKALQQRLGERHDRHGEEPRKRDGPLKRIAQKVNPFRRK